MMLYFCSVPIKSKDRLVEVCKGFASAYPFHYTFPGTYGYSYYIQLTVEEVTILKLSVDNVRIITERNND